MDAIGNNYKKIKLQEDIIYLNEKFKSNEPFAIGKIGFNELKSIECYLNRKIFTDETKFKLFTNNGIFPQTDDFRIKYVDEMVKIIPFMDAMPHWVNEHLDNIAKHLKDFEINFIDKKSPNCRIIEMKSLEPYYSINPWSKHLEGKKVLVISPFAETIKKQYEKRKLLWEDKTVLPDFDLKTLKHQLSPALGIPSVYEDWVQMITDLKRNIEQTHFDVALIGTGGTSLPLVVFCKQLGKQAIHLGGALQILFGIKGNRWLNKPHINCFFNEHWVRPSGDEVPENYMINENGCYW
jgi:hypothetical protein